MTRSKPPVVIALYDSLADGLAALEQRFGVEHVAFIDHDWLRGPAGDIDLFQAFTDHAGRPIGLHETILWTPQGPVPVFMVPLDNAGPFTAFLDKLVVTAQDGSVCIPIHARIDSVPAGQIQPDLKAALARCHGISFATYPADDPVAQRVRRWKKGGRR